MKKHLLSAADLSRDDAELVLRTARSRSCPRCAAAPW
jgi:aspartate carbamoyltransferase catalytic subunit